MGTKLHIIQDSSFQCKWVDNKGGLKVNENGLTLVDLNKESDPNDQFIFSSQAKQVFYVNDPNGGRWSVVLTTKPKLYDRGDVCDNIERPHRLVENFLKVMI